MLLTIPMDKLAIGRCRRPPRQTKLITVIGRVTSRYTVSLGGTRNTGTVNSLADRPPRSASPFDAEVARVRASGTLGESGRLLELFDYLAGRGPDTPSASQAEIAESVFGQTETGVDDATARV